MSRSEATDIIPGTIPLFDAPEGQSVRFRPRTGTCEYCGDTCGSDDRFHTGHERKLRHYLRGEATWNAEAWAELFLRGWDAEAPQLITYRDEGRDLADDITREWRGPEWIAERVQERRGRVLS